MLFNLSNYINMQQSYILNTRTKSDNNVLNYLTIIMFYATRQRDFLICNFQFTLLDDCN